MTSESIYALSSGAGRAAIAIVRVSGSLARFALETFAGRLPEPRRVSLRRLRHAGEVIDQALVLWLPGPLTETGEDMAEFHVHGSPAVVSALLAALGELGLRPADAGEFTRRAFENGRVDLTSVEALADLFAAETRAQLRQAIAQLDGRLSVPTARWRALLIGAMARLEAQLDFADEGDVQGSDDLGSVRDAVASVVGDIETALASSQRGERVRDGLSVVIAGAPNVGKSTLLNALAGRDVAIVTSVPGTTRDLIEVRMDLGGVAVTLVDTAGLRDTEDPVEAEGIRRARARAARADLVLLLREAGSPGPAPMVDSGPAAWTVWTKIDSAPFSATDVEVGLSARTGEGVGPFLARLAAWASRTVGGEPALVTRERHRLALRSAATHLARASAGLTPNRLELVAEDLRLACRDLDRLLGRVDVEHVLDVLFESFCIGK